jgi:exopolysaccharide biosynthesis protein
MSPRSPSYPGPIINGSPGETNHQTTRAFANSVGAQVAINGSFYASSPGWANNLGLTASNGDKYSPWQASSEPEYRDALNITQSNEALIVKRATSVPTGFETNPVVPIYNAVTGRQRLLLNGANVGPTGCDICGLNPRTAVGLNGDNTKLIMMTVDGRQNGISEGVTLPELANLLSEYSVTNAINLDGGGSTTMAMNFYNDGLGAQVVNVPSDGTERAVGTNLAVFALPNGDYNEDGAWDAADYIVWRKTVGETLAYNAWMMRFGSTTGDSGPSPVPEPTILPAVLLILGFLVRIRF